MYATTLTRAAPSGRSGAEEADLPPGLGATLHVRDDLVSWEWHALYHALIPPDARVLHSMARVAVDANLKGDGFKRNDLLRPLNETVKTLRRARGAEDAELDRLRTDERLLRSAFLTYVRAERDARKADDDTESPASE